MVNREKLFQTLIGTVKSSGSSGSGGTFDLFQTLIGTVKSRRKKRLEM